MDAQGPAPAPPGGSIPLPMELRAYKSQVDTYVMARLKQFAGAFTRRFNMELSGAQVELLVAETVATLAQADTSASNQRVLRLVLRHDCQSTGCGEPGCLLCQYNPSRLCKRNLKNKYLIDDHLRAKCNAPLRVELVDETGVCVSEGLPHGVQLEVHVLNGEKYKEICPDNTLLSHMQLHTCIISHHTKALLKRDGGSDDQLRCYLGLERGQGPLSELQATTSSEALLAGKAPTFRLLVWAVDAMGEPVPNVTYVVSENFVVATKRVKHAIKSDIPSIADSVSKLVHIGKATVDKLLDVRHAAREEGFEINVPDEMNRIDKVGQFQQLMEQCEINSDLKNKIRHLLKLSPEKWDEVSQHALAAVVPDFRNRVWWCPNLRTGLLFACKNGSVTMEHPVALVKMGAGAESGEEDQVVPIHQLDPMLFHSIPRLKQQAVQSWYAASHPGWAIYWKEGQDGAEMASALQFARGVAGGGGTPTTALPSAGTLALEGGPGVPQPVAPPAPSPFEMIAKPLPAAPAAAHTPSPFNGAVMSGLSDAFPLWAGAGGASAGGGAGANGGGAAGGLPFDMSLGALPSGLLGSSLGPANLNDSLPGGLLALLASSRGAADAAAGVPGGAAGHHNHDDGGGAAQAAGGGAGTSGGGEAGAAGTSLDLTRLWNSSHGAAHAPGGDAGGSGGSGAGGDGSGVGFEPTVATQAAGAYDGAVGGGEDVSAAGEEGGHVDKRQRTSVK